MAKLMSTTMDMEQGIFHKWIMLFIRRKIFSIFRITGQISGSTGSTGVEHLTFQEASGNITQLRPPHHKGLLAVERLPQPLPRLQDKGTSCVLFLLPFFQILLLSQAKIDLWPRFVPYPWVSVLLCVGICFVQPTLTRVKFPLAHKPPDEVGKKGC